MEHSLPKSTIFKTAVAAAAAADDDGFAFSAKLLLGGARAAIKYVVLAATALPFARGGSSVIALVLYIKWLSDSGEWRLALGVRLLLKRVRACDNVTS